MFVSSTRVAFGSLRRLAPLRTVVGVGSAFESAAAAVPGHCGALRDISGADRDDGAAGSLDYPAPRRRGAAAAEASHPAPQGRLPSAIVPLSTIAKAEIDQGAGTLVEMDPAKWSSARSRAEPVGHESGPFEQAAGLDASAEAGARGGPMRPTMPG